MNFLDSIAKESPTGIVSLTPDNTIYVRWVGKTANMCFISDSHGRIRHICLPIRENKMRQYNTSGKSKKRRGLSNVSMSGGLAVRSMPLLDTSILWGDA